MHGILIHNGTSGSQGTLGGLAEAGRRIGEHLIAALDEARLCSNDPVCTERDPSAQHDPMHLQGAACHGCPLIAEPSCAQRSNGSTAPSSCRPSLSRTRLSLSERQPDPELGASVAGRPSDRSRTSVHGSVRGPGGRRDGGRIVLAARSGLGPQHAALSLNALAAELKPRADAAVHELATSGPDIAGTTRDTGVVLRELFAEAEHRVLVIGFAVQDGEIFAISRIGCVSGLISRCASAAMSGPSPATRRGRTRCCARRGLRTWCGQALRTSRDVLVNTRKLAHPRGVEPPTPRSVVWCSIQLSYGRVPRSLPACKGR